MGPCIFVMNGRCFLVTGFSLFGFISSFNMGMNLLKMNGFYVSFILCIIDFCLDVIIALFLILKVLSPVIQLVLKY